MNAPKVAIGSSRDGMVHLLAPEAEMHMTWIEAINLSAMLDAMAMVAADSIGCSHDTMLQHLNEAALKSDSIIDEYMERGKE